MLDAPMWLTTVDTSAGLRTTSGRCFLSSLLHVEELMLGRYAEPAASRCSTGCLKNDTLTPDDVGEDLLSGKPPNFVETIRYI